MNEGEHPHLAEKSLVNKLRSEAEYQARCAASDKRLVLIPSAGHNDLMMVGMSQYFGAIRTFVYG
jgi:hypothetical protein